jgi:DNA gyrase/topoisomerase IV subunit A
VPSRRLRSPRCSGTSSTSAPRQSAASSTSRRSGASTSRGLHVIYDPSTGRSASSGVGRKADAASKLINASPSTRSRSRRFSRQLYKLASWKSSFGGIEKDGRGGHDRAILKSEKLWNEVQASSSRCADTDRQAPDEGQAEGRAFIQHEDTVAVLSSDGWVKRVRELKDPKGTRLREGDSVQAVLQGSTKELAALFSNQGSAYVLRLNDVPPSTGYGEPVQKLFKFADGERIVASLSLDPRVTPPGDVLLLAVTRDGMVLRFSADPLRESTTRSGRRFAKPAEGDEVVAVSVCEEGAIVALASEKGRAILFDSDEVPVLAGPGKGVIGIRLADDDRSSAPRPFGRDEKRAVLALENSKGTQHTVTRRYEVVGRGGRGFHLIKRDRLVRAIPPPVALVDITGKEG